MFNEGLVDEVREFRQQGYDSFLKPIQALGYKPVNEFLEGTISLEDALIETTIDWLPR